MNDASLNVSEFSPLITLRRFRRIEEALRRAGYGPMIDWSESIVPPINPEEFAREAIYVICNSGMKNSVAAPIAARCIEALDRGLSAATVFKHPGKAPAIDFIWQHRGTLFQRLTAENAKVEDLLELPWIGPVTMYHLAKNLGADEAKPDVHLERLASGDRTTTRRLCRRLARETGYRIATIDSILWRACADGILNSRLYELEGWRTAFRGNPIKTFSTIVSRAAVRNVPSQRLMQKLGMTRARPMDYVARDGTELAVYSITHEQWTRQAVQAR